MAAHNMAQRICTIATNEGVFLAYLVALPRHWFRWRKAFATRRLALKISLSCARDSLRLNGITANIPNETACATSALVSYPLSASKYAALWPSIRADSWLQPAVVPEVSRHLIAMPCASTVKLILLLSPLGEPHVLIATHLPAGMGMYLDMAGIDHQPLKIRIFYQSLLKTSPGPFITPTAKKAVSIFPVTIVRWQVLPWRAGAKDPKKAKINSRLSRASRPQSPFLPSR